MMKVVANIALTIAIVLTFLLVASLFAGCAVTKSVVLEYDTAGNLVKRTESQESVVKEVTASTKDKTVVCWESGWAAYIQATTATTSDPTPTVRMFAGKTDKGVVSAKADQQGWDGIAKVVNATKYDLSVTTSGISSSGTKTEETK